MSRLRYTVELIIECERTIDPQEVDRELVRHARLLIRAQTSAEPTIASTYTPGTEITRS